MKVNNFWLYAGTLCMMTSFFHLIGGQIDLVNPLMDSELSIEQRTQWLGVWHLVTVLLLIMSYVLLSAGFGKKYTDNIELIKLLAYFNLALCIPSIIASIYYGILVPQWILFLPIGAFILIGLRNREASERVASGNETGERIH